MRVSFTLKLFDDPSTLEKLKVMSPLEAMFDDSRNVTPEEYWEVVSNLKPGQSLTITVENCHA